MSTAPRLLVAPDKFKGSLTAHQVAESLRSGIVRAGATARTLPLADGGDGSVAAALAAGFVVRRVLVPDALGRSHEAEIAVRGTVAVAEVANTCGLVQLGRQPDGETAMTASSRGLGVAVRAAVEAGARTVVLALGGSASTDGGAGFLEGLGARLLGPDGGPVRAGGRGLLEVARVDLAALGGLEGVDLVVASDVTAPLLGPCGAAAVFARQKGASLEDVGVLERGLGRFAELLGTACGVGDLTGVAGAGSAGGIGHAAAALGARIASGADLFLDLLGWDDAVGDCDAVVTGEGALDDQTLLGKLPVVVAGRSQGRPVHLAVGRDCRSAAASGSSRFASVNAVADLTPRDTTRNPDLTRELLEQVGGSIARRCLASPSLAGA